MAHDNAMRYERITLRLDQMGGQPCIRGLRIPVATVVAMVADGMSHDEILAAHPDLERVDIGEALRYADGSRGPERRPEQQLQLLLANLSALEADLEGSGDPSPALSSRNR